MSGFDFGSLRDPDAPQPDAHHREGVEMRARELRRSASRKRMLVSGLALVVVTAAIAGIVATRPNPGPSILVTDPSSTTVPSPSSSVGDRFVPPTTIENGLVVLPVTFPDGESYTLRYPSAMKIAQLGFAGRIGVGDAQAQISYTTIARLYGESKPLATYPGANGATVPVFQGYKPARIVGPPFPDELAFQFGPWLARISLDGKTGAQRATLARSLTGTVDANGYLLLHARAPLSMNNEFEGGFGNGEKGNFVDLASHLYCGQPESYTSVPTRFTNRDGTHGVAWCDGDLLVHVKGSPNFIDLAATKLQVSPLTSPSSSPTTTSTTTTTTPPPTNTPAVSASFVSTQHGWVLRRNGHVEETTDGGATWKSIGSLGVPGSGIRIRFADAMHGFAFDTNPNAGAALLATDDGGATWAPLATPFSHMFDLAISRGRIYVVAMQQSDSNFRIWSSPTDQLTWKEDPLVIPVGAGPVPSIQLIFSGAGGWLVEVDRIVTAGARLDRHGRWLDWSPPCTGMNGPVEVAASSATDLVASCNEHVWGGGPIRPAAYVSHDGGVTFQRRPAPAFGEIASPSATNAVVAANGELRQTTDGGATWSVVTRGQRGDNALDLGFTTSTQGFVIFSDGAMLITYDAGATWSAATLP